MSTQNTGSNGNNDFHISIQAGKYLDHTPMDRRFPDYSDEEIEPFDYGPEKTTTAIMERLEDFGDYHSLDSEHFGQRLDAFQSSMVNESHSSVDWLDEGYIGTLYIKISVDDPNTILNLDLNLDDWAELAKEAVQSFTGESEYTHAYKLEFSPALYAHLQQLSIQHTAQQQAWEGLVRESGYYVNDEHVRERLELSQVVNQIHSNFTNAGFPLSVEKVETLVNDLRDGYEDIVANSRRSYVNPTIRSSQAPEPVNNGVKPEDLSVSHGVKIR